MTVLRLNSNEGPRAPQALLAELAALDPELLRRYPDATAVETALAARTGVSPERVVVTAGADEALDRICRAYAGPDRPVLLPEPTFDMLERFAALAGAPLVRVPWFTDRFPLAEILARLDNRIALVVVVSPNNPTGGVASRDDVRRIAAAAPRSLVLLDQAYIEYADEDIDPAVLDLANVVVVRTPDGVTHAASRETPGLRHRAHDDHVCEVEHGRVDILVRVLDVRLIEQDERSRRSGRDPSHVIARCDAARRIVGRHDDHECDAVVEAREDLCEGEPIREPGHAHEWRAGEGSEALQHVEGRLGQQHRAIGSRVRSADAIECLVRAGGHDDTLRTHPRSSSERRLDCRGIGVAAQQLRIQGCQLGQQSLWCARPLIAVETQDVHGTICERVETTTSVPPAAFTAGITCGNRSRGTAAFTAYPVSPNRRDTVACRIDGRTATTASRQAAEAFTSSITRRRASSTELISKTRSSMKRRRTGSSSAARCAYRRVDERINTSTIARPFASSVAPVAVLSTITSASSGGNTSVAP